MLPLRLQKEDIEHAELAVCCSNPLAGTDATLLGLSGAGYADGKSFGFAACDRTVGASEGINAVMERRLPRADGQVRCSVSCLRLAHSGSWPDVNCCWPKKAGQELALLHTLACLMLVSSGLNATCGPDLRSKLVHCCTCTQLTVPWFTGLRAQLQRDQRGVHRVRPAGHLRRGGLRGRHLTLPRQHQRALHRPAGASAAACQPVSGLPVPAVPAHYKQQHELNGMLHRATVVFAKLYFVTRPGFCLLCRLSSAPCRQLGDAQSEAQLTLCLQAAAMAVRADVSGTGGAMLPGMIFNGRKRVSFTDALTGEKRSVLAGRLECTMQVCGPCVLASQVV